MARHTRRMMAANWKMHKSGAEASAYLRRLRELVSPAATIACAVVVAPPFTAIAAAVEGARGSGIAIAGQDLHWAAEGAYTGEVSGGMLAAAGCAYVIVGHSERRRYFGETDEWVRQKAAAALGAGLRPILCVGETAEQRAAGEVERVLGQQLERAWAGLDAEQAAGCVLAYEPVWAIGTGQRATPATAEAAHAFLRRMVREMHGDETAAGMTILYGGSMAPSDGDLAELLAQPDVDGGLVGGASLDPEGFAALVGAAARPTAA